MAAIEKLRLHRPWSIDDGVGQGQSPAMARAKEAGVFALEGPCRNAIVAALAFGTLQCSSAAGGSAYCAAGAGPRAPVPVPKQFEADVAKTFGLPIDVVRRGAFVRCAQDKLLACSVGANLNCRKANTRRSLPGVNEFCRTNPGADNIPKAATGHDTIYAWRASAGARSLRRPLWPSTRMATTPALEGVDR